MKRRALAVALAVGLFRVGGYPALAQTKPSWQSSETVNVQLTVRDKHGERNYEATFIVHTPDGLKLSKTVQVEGDDEGVVTFPDDFRVPSRYAAGVRGGRYKWECLVEGKAVVGGRFTVETTHDPIPARNGRRAGP